MVHKSFATKSSKYLQRMARTKDRLTLHGEKSEDFHVYVHWLYHGEIITNDAIGENSYGTTLVRLYLMGDYIEDEQFTDTIYDIIYRSSQDISMKFESAAIRLTWKRTWAGCELRWTLLYDMLATSLGIADSPTFLNPLGWPTEVSIGSLMQALENRQYVGLLGEDYSEMGEMLTELLGKPPSQDTWSESGDEVSSRHTSPGSRE